MIRFTTWKNDESDSDPQVLQVSSAVRDILIGEGFAKVNVLNALLDTMGMLTRQGNSCRVNARKMGPGIKRLRVVNIRVNFLFYYVENSQLVYLNNLIFKY